MLFKQSYVHILPLGRLSDKSWKQKKKARILYKDYDGKSAGLHNQSQFRTPQQVLVQDSQLVPAQDSPNQSLSRTPQFVLTATLGSSKESQKFKTTNLFLLYLPFCHNHFVKSVLVVIACYPSINCSTFYDMNICVNFLLLFSDRKENVE